MRCRGEGKAASGQGTRRRRSRTHQMSLWRNAIRCIASPHDANVCRAHYEDRNLKEIIAQESDETLSQVTVRCQVKISSATSMARSAMGAPNPLGCRRAQRANQRLPRRAKTYAQDTRWQSRGWSRQPLRPQEWSEWGTRATRSCLHAGVVQLVRHLWTLSKAALDTLLVDMRAASARVSQNDICSVWNSAIAAERSVRACANRPLRRWSVPRPKWQKASRGCMPSSTARVRAWW
jgi:hypothetical protein